MIRELINTTIQSSIALLVIIYLFDRKIVPSNYFIIILTISIILYLINLFVLNKIEAYEDINSLANTPVQLVMRREFKKFMSKF